MAEVVYDYAVRFVGDDISTEIVITEETADIDHEEIIKQAEKRLCEMWGAKEIPDNYYYIIDVEVHEIEL